MEFCSSDEKGDLVMILYFSGYGGLAVPPEYDPEGVIKDGSVMLSYSKKQSMLRILRLRITRIVEYRKKK